MNSVNIEQLCQINIFGFIKEAGVKSHFFVPDNICF